MRLGIIRWSLELMDHEFNSIPLCPRRGIRTNVLSG
jgi:hypothetical protein